jgi:glycosyltransferase involved in cell wall biosynthesis
MDDLASLLNPEPDYPATLEVIEPRGSEKLGSRIRVLHIVADLRTGGAETMLIGLIKNSDPYAFEHRVLSMRSRGDFETILKQLDIRIDALGIHSWLDGLAKIGEIRKIVRDFRPDIVHTWLYHANVIGGIAGSLWSDAKIVWGLHCGWLSSYHTKRLTRLMRMIGAKLSNFVPHNIICCAYSVREFHAGIGYNRAKLAIVGNGVELTRFAPSEIARAELRRELNVSPNQLLVGMIARFDPQKDFRTFIEAAVIVRRRYPDARFVLCGPGFETSNEAVVSELREKGLEESFVLLGLRSDVPRLMAALDTLVLSSLYGEALPLVVIEAMACGVPVVASDIGDIQRAVGPYGRVVQPRLPREFAEGITYYAGLTPEQRQLNATNARARVASMFSLPSVIRQHEALYRRLVKNSPATLDADGSTVAVQRL